MTEKRFEIKPCNNGLYSLSEWVEDKPVRRVGIRKVYEFTIPAHWKFIGHFPTQELARKRVEHIRQDAEYL